jgi:hypothetical protein
MGNKTMKKTICLITFIILAMLFMLVTGGNAQEIREFDFSWGYIPRSSHISETKVLFSIWEIKNGEEILLEKNIPYEVREFTITHEYYEGDTLHFCMYTFSYVERPENAMSGKSNIVQWPEEQFLGDGIPPDSPIFVEIDTTRIKKDVKLNFIVKLNPYNISYKKYYIEFENYTAETIDEFRFEIYNAVIDWVTEGVERPLIFYKELNEYDNDKVVGTEFTLENPLQYRELRMDIDNTATKPGFDLDRDIQGKAWINGHSGILEKDGNNYICEIKY